MVEMTKCVVADVNISASTGTSWWYKITRWLRIRLGRYTVEESLLDNMANEITKEIDKEILNTLIFNHPHLYRMKRITP